MIRSFGEDRARAVFVGGPTSILRHIPAGLLSGVRRKLDVLDSAISLDSINELPGTRLERLAGDLAGFHSIRVNEQWRLIFRWQDGDATDVRLVDYHG